MQRRLVLSRYYHNDSRGVMAVDLSAMRKLFNKGGLKTAIVAPAAMQSGWELIVVHTDGKLGVVLI